MKPRKPFCLFLLMVYMLVPHMALAADQGTTIYLIRHTEKVLDGSNDPDLTLAGLERAKQWAKVLDRIELHHIFSTDTTRTHDTASIIAVAKGLPVQIYDHQTMDYAAFIAAHKGKNVLMVGHSNTVPGIANGLLGKRQYEDLSEDDYGSLFIVNLAAGSAHAQVLQVNPWSGSAAPDTKK
ncbi:MAG: histidine phosphatase family protein [Gammaproteobacteria bacterium]|nr:histidine phosphatase family protein [Gammaproteobacteria bacterium]